MKGTNAKKVVRGEWTPMGSLCYVLGVLLMLVVAVTLCSIRTPRNQSSLMERFMDFQLPLKKNLAEDVLLSSADIGNASNHHN